MSFQDHRSVREEVRHRRCAPRNPVEVCVPFDRGQALEETPSGPVELILTVTDAEGAVANWFGDDWWTAALEKWADEPVTVQIEPTPAALIHPVVLHHVEMIHRVVPHWRVVGNGFVDDITTDDEVQLLAGSAYHEVRFTDRPRNPRDASDRAPTHGPIERLFARIRAEQNRLKVSTPVLVLAPSERGAAPSSASLPVPKGQSASSG